MREKKKEKKRQCLPTYLHTYIPTYLLYLHTYIHTYIHTSSTYPINPINHYERKSSVAWPAGLPPPNAAPVWLSQGMYIHTVLRPTEKKKGKKAAEQKSLKIDDGVCVCFGDLMRGKGKRKKEKKGRLPMPTYIHYIHPYLYYLSLMKVRKKNIFLPPIPLKHYTLLIWVLNFFFFFFFFFCAWHS